MPTLTRVHLRCGAPQMAWAWRGPEGWGELSFYLDEDGEWHCQAEGQGVDFAKQALSQWIDTVVFDGAGD